VQYGDVRQQIKNELVGSIVMTTYNRKTYRIDDIDWEKTPRDKFDCQDRQVSFHEYYRDKYSQPTTDMNQPLLVSRAKKKDFHRGQTGPALLIPELCQMTGLTDGMRSNFQLMKSLSTHLHKTPAERVRAVQNFMKRLRESTDAKQELVKWGLQFSPDLIRLTGRTLGVETLKFGEVKVTTTERADWDNAYKTSK
jgi:aubergine-like protein